jgi:hypothetical protein
MNGISTKAMKVLMPIFMFAKGGALEEIAETMITKDS